MSRRSEGMWLQQQPQQQQSSSPEHSPPLPADHVLFSGAVLFPGVFDLLGSPLVMFPVDAQAERSAALSKAEVVDFINYCLCQHNKKQKGSLVSVVADLREASASSTRFIAETLLLLELQKRTVHTAYIIQPKKKDVLRLLDKLWAPSKTQPVAFKKVLLKEVFELSNYIDRSQLTASLGGYLVYCHQSWAAFTKEMDAFEQDFVSVVQRLPDCISTLQALSRRPLPSSIPELQLFCSSNEASFWQLRRELGLDDLLRHCDLLLEKLRRPELDRCFQAMAGTALFTQNSASMLQNHSRITAAVQKVELLWKQVFSKAQLQLHVLQLRDAALQITEQIETLLQQKLQPYKIQIAEEAAEAERLTLEFHSSIYTPAMSLVGSAEEVVHTLAELLSDAPSRERWLLDLQRLKEKLHSTVHFTLQTLRAVSHYHRFYNKAHHWYRLVLSENFLQELLSGVDRQRQRRSLGTLPAWRKRLCAFLKKNPPPDMEELVHLTHLSNVIPDERVQREGRQLSQRCMTLRRLIISSEPVAVAHLQVALQWQYELLRSSQVDQSSADRPSLPPAQSVHSTPERTSTTSPQSPLHRPESDHRTEAPRADLLRPSTTAEGKQSSLSSFDSGFEGARSSLLGLALTRDSGKPALTKPQIDEETVSDSDVSEFGSLGNSSRASVHIVPNAALNTLNFEIKVKRSAALPTNPWLSLPDDDLENSYIVTIIPKPSLQHTHSNSCDISDLSHIKMAHFGRCEDPPSRTPTAPPPTWALHSLSSLEDSELSPITHVLSSTITEPKDQSCTEGRPTMLWDSYDLHEQYLDATDGVSVSLKDWDIKEQENLTEVERILERADEILAEEESVLAQEAQLDVLLRTEERPHPWGAWDNQMTASELAEAGVLGLDQDSSESQSETDLSSHLQARDWSCKPNLLTELKEVHALDQRILEENLKINQLRQEECPEEILQRNSLDTQNQQSVRMQLKKEEHELKNLEKSLDSTCKVKKRKDRATRVIRCSIMSRTESEEDKAICNELLSSRSSSEGPHSETDQSHSSFNDPPQTEDKSRISLCNETAVNIFASEKSDRPKAVFQAISSALEQSNESRLGNTLDGPPAELPASHDTLVTSKNPVKPSPDLCVTPECSVGEGGFDPGGAARPRPVPKPRKTTLLNLNNQPTEQDSLHSTELSSAEPTVSQRLLLLNPKEQPDRVSADRGAPDGDGGRDTGDACDVGDAGDRGAPTEDSGDIGAPTEDAGDVVTPAGDVAAPTEDAGDVVTPAGDVAAPTEDSGDKVAPAEDAGEGGAHVGDGRGTAELGEDLSLGPNVNLHTNNNNNKWLQNERDAGETHTSEDVTDQQTDEAISTVPPSGDTSFVEKVPSSSDPEYNPRKGVVVERSEGTKMSAPGIQDQLNINITLPTDFGTPIVLDTGSGLMKAGFADQDLPSVLFPTIIGVPKYEEIMNGSSEKDTYVGHSAQHMRGVLALRHPIINGIISNWDDMEQIWQHTFDLLRVDPVEHPVLLTEAPMNPLENRQHAVEIMFEFFGVPYSYVAMQAVLALYAAGRTTGVVFDSGDGVSHSVPVFDGYTLPHAIQRFPLAGADVTSHLRKLLQEQGVSMRTTAELEIVREMKEKCCCVSLDYEVELRDGASCGEMIYTLPDGQTVTLGSERIRAPEILFKPELIGRDHYGLHESILKSILSSDIDLRRCFLENILLSGGNTLLPGLPERLQAELARLVPSDSSSCVRVSSPSERDFSVWSGGAVLANLPSFCGAWISQSEYDEYGPQIVFRKCF